MKSRNRIASFIIVTAFIAGFIFTISPIKAQATVTITFWYTENDTEKPGVIALVNEFEEQNPDISVDALQKGFFDARALYTNAFIAGTEPELFRAARDWVTEFAVAGMIKPITSELSQEDLDDFLPSAIRLITYPDSDGVDQIWAFPHLVDTPALMYNKHILSESGVDISELSVNTSYSWEEFVEVAKNCTNAPTQYGYTIQGMFTGGHATFFGHGARLFDDGIVDVNHIAIDSQKSRDALAFLKNMIDVEKITPKWEEMGWETINVMFADEGSVAMIQQGPWELKNFLDNSPEFNPGVTGAKPYASPDNLGIMLLPHDDVGNQGAPLGGHAFVMTSFIEEAKYEATVKLAKFMSSADSMAAGAIDYYHVPARESVMSRDDVKNSDAYEYVLGFKKNVDKAYQVPVHHLWSDLEGDLADNIDEYLADDITLDQCIAQTIAEWKERLGQKATGTATTTTNGGLGEETPGFSFLAIFFAVPVLVYRIKQKKYKNR
ncbi:MAG: extracellular solute-binding protein [Candidatus Hodarchaeales archaeon]|jgi:arabinogalactan oligomer/maltooligosaccharide transport system substrate-binding protein